MKKGLAILSAVLCLLLCACHRDADTAPEIVTLSNVYNVASLSAPEMRADVSSSYQPFVYGDSLYLFDKIQEVYLYRFSLDGAYRETIAVPSLYEKDLSLRQVLLLQNGDFLGYAIDTESRFYLLTFTSAGEIVHRIQPEDADYSTLIGAVNGMVYSISNTTITVLDESLTELRRVLTEFMPTECRTLAGDDGVETVYLRDAMGSLYILDGENGAVLPLYVPEVWDNTTAAYPGYGYDWYFTDDEGIFGMTGDEKTLLCRFSSSNLSYHSIDTLYALSPEIFLTRYHDTVQNTYSYVWLTFAGESAEYAALRLAWAAGTAYNLETLRTIVQSFNTSETEYFVEIVNYGSIGAVDTERLRKDQLAGEQFDLYATGHTYGGGQLYSSMEKNGSFADLSEILDENILPSALNAYNTREAVFGLPFGVTYEFYAAPTHRNGTIADMEKALQNADDTHLLAFTDIANELTQTYVCSLTQNDTLVLGTPEFMKILELAKASIPYCDNQKYGYLGYEIYDNYSAYRYTSDSFFYAVEEDLLSYVQVPVTVPDMIGTHKILYGDVPAHLVGMPVADGREALFGRVSVTLSASAGGNIDGAKEFLRYYLSDAVQTSPMLLHTQFPITETGLAKATEAHYYYYKINANTSQIIPHSYYVSRPSNPRSEEFPDIYREAVLTDEELEAFRDLIRDAVLSTGQDDMVSQILLEELEPYFAGDRTAEATAEIIEKRVGIYLAE